MKHSTPISSSWKRWLLCITFGALSLAAIDAQSITWAFVNAAGFDDGPEMSLRWTIGEALTLEVQDATARLRVGFMPFAYVDQGTSASQSLDPDIEISIIPNPASEEIQLRVPGDARNLVRIVSIDGKSKLAAEVTYETRIDITTLPAGPYILYVIDPSGAFNTKTFIKS